MKLFKIQILTVLILISSLAPQLAEASFCKTSVSKLSYLWDQMTKPRAIKAYQKIEQAFLEQNEAISNKSYGIWIGKRNLDEQKFDLDQLYKSPSYLMAGFTNSSPSNSVWTRFDSFKAETNQDGSRSIVIDAHGAFRTKNHYKHPSLFKMEFSYKNIYETETQYIVENREFRSNLSRNGFRLFIDKESMKITDLQLLKIETYSVLTGNKNYEKTIEVDNYEVRYREEANIYSLPESLDYIASKIFDLILTKIDSKYYKSHDATLRAKSQAPINYDQVFFLLAKYKETHPHKYENLSFNWMILELAREAGIISES